MAKFMPPSIRKSTPRTELQGTEPEGAPSPAQAGSSEAMHDEIAERACTSRNVSAKTKVDASMSREEIIAKIMDSAQRAAESR